MGLDISRPEARARIPLWLKLAYTAFVAVVLPIYWKQYTPLNFLWFCDVALLTTLAGLWIGSPLLFSMQAAAIILPQFLWQVDFLLHLVTGYDMMGLSAYMFDSRIPAFDRGLSLFHFWLPLLLLWLLWRVGYDRRAWLAQTLYGWLVLLLCFVFVSDIAGPAGNVNKILGWSDSAPETAMPHWLWLLVLMAVLPVCIYLPAHLILRRSFRPPA